MHSFRRKSSGKTVEIIAELTYKQLFSVFYTIFHKNKRRKNPDTVEKATHTTVFPYIAAEAMNPKNKTYYKTSEILFQSVFLSAILL